MTPTLVFFFVLLLVFVHSAPEDYEEPDMDEEEVRTKESVNSLHFGFAPPPLCKPFLSLG